MKQQLLIILAVFLTFSFKAEAKPEYSFQEHISILKKELETKNYDSSILDKAFDNKFELDKTVKKAVKKQPEVKFSFDRYLTSKMDPKRVREGKKLYKEHYNFLKELEKKYKVDPEIIVSLWGLETNYGKYPINYNPVKALATMSYTHHRKGRRNFFKRELFALFELHEKKHIDILKVKSSWAGALGQCQFMPSNVLNYAIDGNNDGEIDIWNNEKDVLASIANFLKRLRYKQTKTNYVVLKKIKNKKEVVLNRKYYNVDYWSNLIKNHTLLDQRINYRVYAPKNKEKKFFLVSKNFDIIKRWNNSDYFAFSVLSLAKEIKG